MCDIFWVA